MGFNETHRHSNCNYVVQTVSVTLLTDGYKELGLLITIIIIIHLELQRLPKIWTQLKSRIVPMSRDRSAANCIKGGAVL